MNGTGAGPAARRGRGAGRLPAEGARAAIGRSGSDGGSARADAYRAFARSRPGLYRATLSAPKPEDVELTAVATEFLSGARAVLSPLGLGGDDEIHALRALRSLIHGFVSLEAAHGFGFPQDVDESYHVMLRAFVSGFSPPSAAGDVRAARLAAPAR